MKTDSKRINYHNPNSCNNCRGPNELDERSSDNGILYEARTKCTRCGFEDYWAHGWFESGSEMVSNCETYSFDKEGEAE